MGVLTGYLAYYGVLARPAARAAARAWLRLGAIGFRCRARFAAGRTWTSRTTSAQWAGRSGHTSVIGAAGAIYVIGGQGSGGTLFQDVWASTDGGARAGLRRGGGRGGYCRGTSGVLQGTKGTTWGYCRGTHGYMGVIGGTKGVLGVTKGLLRGTKRGEKVLRVYPGCAQGY
jgi:hypothetical protein